MLRESRWEKLEGRVDGASIAAFRWLFGLTIAYHLIASWLDGRLERFVLRPQYHFKYPGFSWVEAPSRPVLLSLVVILATAGILLALGVWYRRAAIILAAGLAYLFVVDSALYVNHFYAAVLFATILAAGDVGAALSPAREQQHAAAQWTLWLLRFQVGAIYLFAGIAKLSPDWLSGHAMSRLVESRADIPFVGLLAEHGVATPMLVYGGLVHDLLVVPALLWRRSRPAAVVVAIAFNLINSQLLDIEYFPVLMIGGTLLFLDPDWPRRAWGMISAGTRQPKLVAIDGRTRLRWGRSAILAYVALQVVVPLRHFAYPGDVLWTEEGQRFAWRMMLRRKTGYAEFVVISRDHRRSIVSPDAYLERWQVGELVRDPYMVQQLAAVIASAHSSDNGRLPEVRGIVMVSLNGGPFAPLVDSTRNLAAVPRSFGHADWIMPRPGNAARQP